MTNIHGINGLIYISGTELVGGNSWSIDVSPDVAQQVAFGGSWKESLKGAQGWSGSVNAYHKNDSKLIFDAALATQVSLLIYPDRNTLTSYYSGNAIFGASSDGNTTSVVNRNGSFTGNGALTATGFA